ncbi:FAD-dependent thymidylate synthase [bacterium]|nr:FAD-dependent thymidylate synthase [bacterium]
MISRDELIELANNVYKKDAAINVIKTHIVHTIVFTCDRGVTHEFVRHRPASFAQESTRYCNYSYDKFGKEITVIKPCFWDDDSKQMKLWKKACDAAESAYFDLLISGATPQQARDVLPTSVKTELVITANEHEWQHIINLRYHGTTGAPHPQMVECMTIAVPFLFKESDNRLK